MRSRCATCTTSSSCRSCSWRASSWARSSCTWVSVRGVVIADKDAIGYGVKKSLAALQPVAGQRLGIPRLVGGAIQSVGQLLGAQRLGALPGEHLYICFRGIIALG